MTITQMRYFYEVCRWQNITKAANELHVSQPTVSIAMTQLEQELGIKLFRKDGKKIIITNEANTLLVKITPILSSVAALEQDIKDMTVNKNVIRLIVPLQIGAKLLPKLYQSFSKEYPEIKLEIIESGGLDAMRLLEEGGADLSINNYYKSFSDKHTYIKLMESEACFCTYPEHPLATKQFVTFADIAKEKMVLLNGGYFINRLVQEYFTRNDLHPEVLLYTPYLHTVKNFIQQNVASSILMRQAITDYDRIVPISLQIPQLIHTGIIYQRGRQLRPAEKQLINYIKKNLQFFC